MGAGVGIVSGVYFGDADGFLQQLLTFKGSWPNIVGHLFEVYFGGHNWCGILDLGAAYIKLWKWRFG